MTASHTELARTAADSLTPRIGEHLPGALQHALDGGPIRSTMDVVARLIVDAARILDGAPRPIDISTRTALDSLAIERADGSGVSLAVALAVIDAIDGVRDEAEAAA